ncbi:hypothetical protein LX36DRAFT_653129, partial [Colletotrichum falcatum]
MRACVAARHTHTLLRIYRTYLVTPLIGGGRQQIVQGFALVVPWDVLAAIGLTANTAYLPTCLPGSYSSY